jgi:hypothetical protein
MQTGFVLVMETRSAWRCQVGFGEVDAGDAQWWSGTTHAQPFIGHARADLHSPGKPSHPQLAKCDTRLASGTLHCALVSGSPPGIVPIQRTPAKRGASLVHALKKRLLVLDTDFGQVLIDSFLDLVVEP